MRDILFMVISFQVQLGPRMDTTPNTRSQQEEQQELRGAGGG